MACHISVALRVYPSTVPLAHQSAYLVPAPWNGLGSEGFPYPCNELSEFEQNIRGRPSLADCGKTIWAQLKFDASTSGVRDKRHAGCSKSPSSKAAASKEATAYASYVEPLSEARTKLVDFFSILLETRRAGEAQRHSRPQCRSNPSLLIRLRGIAQVGLHGLKALGEQCLRFSVVHGRSDDAILSVLPVGWCRHFEL